MSDHREVREELFDTWRKSVNGEVESVESYLESNNLVKVSKDIIALDERNQWAVTLLVSVVVSHCLRLENQWKIIKLKSFLPEIIAIVRDIECRQHMCETEIKKIQVFSNTKLLTADQASLIELFQENSS